MQPVYHTQLTGIDIYKVKPPPARFTRLVSHREFLQIKATEVGNTMLFAVYMARLAANNMEKIQQWEKEHPALEMKVENLLKALLDLEHAMTRTMRKIYLQELGK